MPQVQLLQVHVDVILSREPLAGWVRVEDGPEVAFVGVLELISLLDRARGAAFAPVEETR